MHGWIARSSCREKGECLSLVENQGRMRSTAQSIGRKCEICEPPFTDLLPMVEMHGNTCGVANRVVVFDCRCGPNNERRATPPGYSRAEFAIRLRSECRL
jgi:hypothetical protein